VLAKLFSLVTFSLILTACTSRPPAPPAIPVDPSKHLKNTALAQKLPIPVLGVKAQQLSDTWGASRSQGRRHEGIDIMAARGTKVLSATEGIIADLRNNNLGGKVIWILGPNSSWHYYAHLDEHRHNLKVGDYVHAGEHIGYVGNTGNAQYTAPHLHYGLYLDGKGRGAVNPFLYLQ